MRTVVVVPPEPVVTWAEANTHLRLDDDYTQQQLVESLIAAATADLDGPSGILGRAVGDQTLELRTCGLQQTDLTLPYGPVREVVSVKYLDAGGDEQTVDPSLYELAGDVIRLAYNQTWPSVRGDAECVRIRYTAGLGTNALAAVKAAILLQVEMLFDGGAGDSRRANLQAAIDRIIGSFRIIPI